MRAPLLLEALLQRLRLLKVAAPVREDVQELYDVTYREAYADGRADCEDRFVVDDEDDEEIPLC